MTLENALVLSSLQAGGPGSGWYKDSPNPHVPQVTKASRQEFLKQNGFKFSHHIAGHDVWKAGTHELHVSKYNNPDKPSIKFQYHLHTDNGPEAGQHFVGWNKGTENTVAKAGQQGTKNAQVEHDVLDLIDKGVSKLPDNDEEDIAHMPSTGDKGWEEDKGFGLDDFLEDKDFKDFLEDKTAFDKVGEGHTGMPGTEPAAKEPSIPAAAKNSTLEQAGYKVTNSTPASPGNKAKDVWEKPGSSTIVHVVDNEDGTSSWKAYDGKGLATPKAQGDSAASLSTAIKPQTSETSPTKEMSQLQQKYGETTLADKVGEPGSSKVTTDQDFRSNLQAHVDALNKQYSTAQSKFSAGSIHEWTTQYKDMVSKGEPANQATAVKAATGKGLYAEAAAKAGISPTAVIDAQSKIQNWTSTSTNQFRDMANAVTSGSSDAHPGMVLEYAHTQAMLNDLHPSGSVTLSRGMKADNDHVGDASSMKAQVAALKAITVMPQWQVSFKSGGAESWSGSSSVAHGFKSGSAGVVISQPIPIAHVLTSYSTNPTSFGNHYSEKEYIVAPPDKMIHMNSKTTNIQAGKVGIGLLEAMHGIKVLTDTGWQVNRTGSQVVIQEPQPEVNWLQVPRHTLVAEGC